MSVDAKLPKAPSGNIAGWVAFISLVLVGAFVVDHYWGKGDLFGLAKKNMPAPTETA